MVDMLKSREDEDNRRREEVQFYSIQQQLDELRRQLKENLARQQWFEELYKQNEGKLQQVQMAQDRLTQDIAQSLHARQMEDTRLKTQVGELLGRIELPEKQLKEVRAQMQEVIDSRKGVRGSEVTGQRQLDDITAQIRDIHSHLGKLSDSQRQLRDLVQELDSALGEVRQEAIHLAELQSMEEQRLRRQGVELQGLFEALRQQFGEIAARSQRVDDVRRQLTERFDALDEFLERQRVEDANTRHDIDRLEKSSNEQYLLQQERLENVRSQIEAQLGEMRNIGDQRSDRIMTRFTGVDDRLRAIEQLVSEFPTRFEALERRDEVIGSEADSIEEWLVMRQIEAFEHVLGDVRKRRVNRATTLGTGGAGGSKGDTRPGSVYNPQGLIKSVRDARPPSRKNKDEEEAEEQS